MATIEVDDVDAATALADAVSTALLTSRPEITTMTQSTAMQLNDCICSTV